MLVLGSPRADTPTVVQFPSEPSEAFGDPRFTSVDLLPTPDSERSLDSRPAFALWSAVVLHPVVTDLSVAKGTLELRTILPVLTGTALVSLMGFALLRTPQRYGLGFVATARAAFGVRGTYLVALARWLATVLWSGAWVGYVADWSTRLLLATLERFADERLYTLATLWRDALAIAVGAIFVSLAVIASTSPVADQARRAPRRVMLAVILAGVLVGLAAFRLGTLPVPSFGRRGWALEQWGTESLTIALATLPPLMAFTEWARLRVRGGIDAETGRRLGRRKRASAPFILIPVAAVFASLGAVIHAAAAQTSGAAPRGLVASASGFGGALGGGAAVLLGLLLFFSLVPFVGIDAPLRSLVSIAPRYAASLRWFTGVAILATAPLVRLFAPSTLMVAAGVILVPIAAVLMVDDGIVRRGRVQLEELYQAPSRYGPLFGVGVAGLLASAAGWLVSLGHWDGLAWQGFYGDIRSFVNGFSYGGGSSVVLLAGTVSAVLFGVVRVVEGYLPMIPGRRLRGPGPERIEPAASSVELPSSEHEPNELEWGTLPPDADPSAASTGPLDPTVINLAEARYAPVSDSDDEWPDEAAEDSLSEGAWYDDSNDMSNPSVTEIGDPQFVKKRDDDE